MRTPIGRALLLALALATIAGVSPAAADPLDPGARIFPFAGAGTAAPADGRQAGTVKLEALDVEPLAGGAALVVAATGGGAVLQRIDARGRLRRVAAAGRQVRAVSLAPDGSLLLISRTDLRLRRLDLATGAVRAVADLTGMARTPTPHADDVVALPDGSAVVTAGSTPLQGGAPFDAGPLVAYRISRGGEVTRAYADTPAAPRRATGLAALPDGAFALIDLDRNVVVRVAADGALTDLGPIQAGIGGLVALPDGSIVGGSVFGDLARYAPGQAPQPLSRTEGRPTFGNGDGGPLAAAEVSTRAVALTPGGDLLVASFDGVRIVPAAGSRVGVAALAPDGFAALGAGRIGLAATGAGTATVRFTSTRGIVGSRAPQAVADGGGTVRLARAPAPARSTVTVTFTDRATGRVTRTTTRADTRTTLPRAEALAAINALLSSFGDGDEEASFGPILGECVRRGPRRLECSVEDATTQGGRTTRTCSGRVEAVLTLGGVVTRRFPGSCDLVARGARRA